MIRTNRDSLEKALEDGLVCSIEKVGASTILNEGKRMYGWSKWEVVYHRSERDHGKNNWKKKKRREDVEYLPVGQYLGEGDLPTWVGVFGRQVWIRSEYLR